MVLDFGGNDITQFLHTLLMRTNFPYREADLSRWHDFTVLEELKERMVVLSEVRRCSLTERARVSLMVVVTHAGGCRAQSL
jgi:hypothetical protein